MGADANWVDATLNGGGDNGLNIEIDSVYRAESFPVFCMIMNFSAKTS